MRGVGGWRPPRDRSGSSSIARRSRPDRYGRRAGPLRKPSSSTAWGNLVATTGTPAPIGLDQGPGGHLLAALVRQQTNVGTTTERGEIGSRQITVDESNHVVDPEVSAEVDKLASITLPLNAEHVGMGLAGDHI